MQGLRLHSERTTHGPSRSSHTIHCTARKEKLLHHVHHLGPPRNEEELPGRVKGTATSCLEMFHSAEQAPLHSSKGSTKTQMASHTPFFGSSALPLLKDSLSECHDLMNYNYRATALWPGFRKQPLLAGFSLSYFRCCPSNSLSFCFHRVYRFSTCCWIPRGSSAPVPNALLK